MEATAIEVFTAGGVLLANVWLRECAGRTTTKRGTSGQSSSCSSPRSTHARTGRQRAARRCPATAASQHGLPSGSAAHPAHAGMHRAAEAQERPRPGPHTQAFTASAVNAKAGSPEAAGIKRSAAPLPAEDGRSAEPAPVGAAGSHQAPGKAAAMAAVAAGPHELGRQLVSHRR